jgi:hypothetical protein
MNEEVREHSRRFIMLSALLFLFAAMVSAFLGFE